MAERISNTSLLTPRRQNLRINATPQEKMLWARLKNNQLGFKFRRQHSFGAYIADFYCREKSLVIEIDGSQHLENQEYDHERDLFFESRELKVLRFWNNEINTNIEGVVLKVEDALRTRPHPNPPL